MTETNILPLAAEESNKKVGHCITSEAKWRHKQTIFCNVSANIVPHIRQALNYCWNRNDVLCVMALKDTQNLESFILLSLES